MQRSFFILLSLFLVLSLSACGYSQADLDRVSAAAYEDGYSEGLREGYDDGHSDGYNEGYEDGQAFDSLSVSETLQRIEDYFETTFHSFEEVYDVYIFGFQRGYEARRKGLWNETIEEYVNGYLFSDTDPLFSRFE